VGFDEHGENVECSRADGQSNAIPQQPSAFKIQFKISNPNHSKGAANANYCAGSRGLPTWHRGGTQYVG
jgi:hypothetical protein